MEEPVTPGGRFFLQPEMDTIIHCIIGSKFDVDVDAIKAQLEATFLRHPRFSSVAVRDKNGVEHWQQTDVDINKHIIVRELVPCESEDENFPNKYVADLAVSSPLDRQRPLWEVHILQSKCNARTRCSIFRMHHALGDGISIMSLFLASCRRVDEPGLLPTIPTRPTSKRTYAQKFSAFTYLLMTWKSILVIWFTFIDVMYFILRSLWLKDSKTPISGGVGVELWPRKLSISTFNIDDMHAVKNAVNGTINDVLVGIISSGLRRYLDLRCSETSQKESFEKLRFTGLAMVNTRGSPGLQKLSDMMKGISEARWGNQMGYVQLPVSLANFNDPLDYIRKAKVMLDRKKLSYEAFFSYKSGALIMKLLGPKAATKLNYNTIVNTSFTLSNVIGPLEEIMFAGNPITYICATSSSLPHAMTIHMVSYMGVARLQILVARDIIPDPEILARCFEDSLQDMKEVILRDLSNGFE
eukprot:Gb_24731 [translate_table: standard]